MNNLKSSKLFSFAVVAAFLMANVAIGQQQTLPPTVQEGVQEDFSEKEIETFVKINKEIMPLQENIQTDMVSSIEEVGMEVPRFQELAQAQQGGKLQEVSQDPKELEKFNAVGQKIMKLQESLQGEIEKVIDDNKMSTEKFEAIYMAYNTNPEVKQKVDKLISEDT
ncbi:hypothetical protein J2X69_003583 [Algoriphagus sp. 4150]|uniref:DUF4168 domain-containing protein n=1 Tax=Algoriphagus sp. 4150 TaxID=2817756 RepID=UPI002858F665|nr:DUF4168 domain-containing protein [Algoriphagus sp. 4150]MDR7131223.1 hypothetical protein [Algoriphagus sp. 4150]